MKIVDAILLVLVCGVLSLFTAACDTTRSTDCAEQAFFHLLDQEGKTHPSSARFCYALSDVLYGACEYNVHRLPGRGAHFTVQRLQIESCTSTIEAQYGNPARPIVLEGLVQIPDLNGDRRWATGEWRQLDDTGTPVESGTFDFYTKLFFPPGLELPPLQQL